MPFHDWEETRTFPNLCEVAILSIPLLSGKQEPESAPKCILAAFQIRTSFGNRLFKVLDAIKNGFLL
jgi:hypothetical protein